MALDKTDRILKAFRDIEHAIKEGLTESELNGLKLMLDWLNNAVSKMKKKSDD